MTNKLDLKKTLVESNKNSANFDKAMDIATNVGCLLDEIEKREGYIDARKNQIKTINERIDEQQKEFDKLVLTGAQIIELKDFIS